MIIQWKWQKRFKRLDLIDRVPEKLWMEIWNIIQEMVRKKTITKKKKYKKAKRLSLDALQITRKEEKGKWKKERYTHLNAKFQWWARIDKKASFSEQYKEIEDDNRIRKTRIFFKKIRDAKGILHAKKCTIKDRNGMDLTEVEDIKKR